MGAYISFPTKRRCSIKWTNKPAQRSFQKLPRSSRLWKDRGNWECSLAQCQRTERRCAAKGKYTEVMKSASCPSNPRSAPAPSFNRNEARTTDEPAMMGPTVAGHRNHLDELHIPALLYLLSKAVDRAKGTRNCKRESYRSAKWTG